MKYLGQAFKELREARHISLANATGGYFSPSMLSKFESGKHDLSAQKIIDSS
ncbi:transcriptional activator Rgg/GadR/MutR [Streptococcus infantarius subsp. infantarius]|nr:transcriptional activator Rgg/GadR/MutR [Streptococcus infantarius subsp. infantarius]MCO4637317.1 transcriptional activator Rgg/GadR/MutR [Streptococcus infantarius subsp. infantarius]MCO4642446.1 transcriptional activator Rgg/GadR/MutR [Streptococcus infantarius subsp. infantarius]MCO4643280.1 transcriptional activator Rgg/GadR/MutR [Streptococcus infantarius subsp. infantarius]MCO4651176.1 transcriptional activator Rgg/GadR/MutR [Streptococcus infantarius subsp. infantarius]